jgi:hypothetical protein
MATVNVTDLYPNSPTPNLSPNDWDFDPGYNLLLEGDEVRREKKPWKYNLPSPWVRDLILKILLNVV